MTEITASLVKALREKSGVGMMDCKKALQETGGDMEAAIDWLRAKGLSKAAKKADRIAAEGVIAVATRRDGDGMTAAARGAQRRDRLRRAQRAVPGGSAADSGGRPRGRRRRGVLREARVDGQTVDELITHLIATIGENMVLRRAARLTVSSGSIGAYVHGAQAGAPDLGRIGVLVAVRGSGDRAVLDELARNIALHVAAAAPLSLSVEDLDPAHVDRERAIFAEQAAASGKPPSVVERMVEGRVRKFHEESVLLKQAYVREPDLSIERLVEQASKATGSSPRVEGFVRFALGEGVEKAGGDFAAEVAAMTGKTPD